MQQAYMPKSKSQIHITPKRVWDLIEECWGYKKESFFDPCPVNHKRDGLKIPWRMLNYVNPPFEKKVLEQFVFKALYESTFGKVSIMLLPCKTDQDWFQRLIYYNYDIRFIPGRLKFEGHKHNSPQPHFLIKIC